MIAIYTVEQAQKSILRREPLNRERYSPLTLAKTAEFFGEGVEPPQAVAQIIRAITAEGDRALRRWSLLLDRFDGEDLAVPQEKIERAYRELPMETQQVLQRAAARIRDFHQRQPVTGWLAEEGGGHLGQRVTPVERAGIYVPGGSAPLPSSLLMSAIPAQVAGVQRIVVCTPPPANPAILAAAHICQIKGVYQIGGAQAIAAMALGTETVPKVDLVVGAGNLFVTLAKQQLYGAVGLDGLAGPTETMVIADSTANPQWVAADLLAQAEHDVQASAILLTPDRVLAGKVQQAVSAQSTGLSRRAIIQESLRNQSGIVITASLDQAAELANAYAAEHLCLSVADPQALMGKINNAGGFFLGDHSFEVLGDYVAGPSHVMPTGGTARFASPLNVFNFVKISSVIALDGEVAKSLSSLAAAFAEVEGLTAHAAAARARLKGGGDSWNI